MTPMAASVSISLMLPVSTKIFMTAPCSFVFNGVFELADPLDLDRHHVAGDERADSRGCAGRDDVAGFERHHERDVFDQEVDRKNQLTRRRTLPPFAVDPSLDPVRSTVGADRDARTERREC